MNTGVTYIEVNYDAAWINNSLAGLQNFAWLYEWGMYILLLVAIAILFWIFFDSITKKKDQKALIPRILSMVGLFAIIPAFIFRFTGNADGITTLVRLGAEPGMPYYPGPINWNVNWLVGGFGPIIAIIALVGVVLSIVALVIYASAVQRAKPSTEFVQAFDNKMSSLERKVDEASRKAAANQMQGMPPVAQGGQAKTILENAPHAATIMDVQLTGDTLTVQAGYNRGAVYNLPARNMTIGRDASRCDIVFDDGKVSGEHARLLYNGGSWFLMDMGSLNGTYLNGQKIVGQQFVSNGSTIKVGDTVLAFGAARQ